MDAKNPDSATLSNVSDDLTYLSLIDLSELIRTKAVSPVEATETMLARIEALDDGLQSYLTVLDEHARTAAKQAESGIVAGFWRGPLHGVPIAVKDLCDTNYGPSSAGMDICRNYVPERSSTVVERLDAAGGVMLGKLSMTEGAMSGHHPKMKTPVSPWGDKVWTGASSSGSGVATAAGLCYGSLGSDTGGSIRLPSAACGLSGVKPTWGRVSRAGVFALADSLDHVGPMARTAADTAAMLAVIAGQDPRDPTTLPNAVPDYLGGLGGSISGLRIGLDESYVFEGTDPEVADMIRDTIEALKVLGAVFVPIEFPSVDDIIDNWMAICTLECAVAHEDTFPSRKDEYGPVLSGFIEGGRATSGLDMARAMQYRLKLNGAVKHALHGVDLMLAPAVPDPIGESAIWNAPLTEESMATIGKAVRFTAVFDMTGQPTLSLNGGFDKRGVPLGFQLIGHHLDEGLILQAGHAFQTITSFHTRHPGFSKAA